MKKQLTDIQAKLQELYLQLSYTIVSCGSMDTKMPDVMGIVTRTQTSPASAMIAKEIAQIGQWVCSSQDVQYHEKSLLRYAKAVTEIDLAFLEKVRDEASQGLAAFEVIALLKGKNERKVRSIKYASVAFVLIWHRLL